MNVYEVYKYYLHIYIHNSLVLINTNIMYLLFCSIIFVSIQNIDMLHSKHKYGSNTHNTIAHIELYMGLQTNRSYNCYL